MNKKTHRYIIGITDDGQPIVTANYQCPYFEAQEDRLINIKECWYCKFADFRKSCEMTLHQSICRCPKNLVNVVANHKNETYQHISPIIDNFVSNIKGGVITCIFNRKTQSSKAVYLNAGWAAITGYTLDELNQEKNGNPQALVYPDDKPVADFEYNEQLKLGNEYALIYRVINKNGSIIWVIDRGVVTTLANGDIQNQSIVTEVTEIKEQEARLRRLAQIDQLTDLYNKATFTQQSEMILSKQYDRLHAIIILDIDDFKGINDTKGHAYGDKVLQSVAYCLKSLFFNRDIVGRIGGDEFMILMTDISHEEIVACKAAELCTRIRNIKIDGKQDVSITASLGFAFSSDNQNYQAMFQQADSVLYLAKARGKNQYCSSH